MPLEHLPSTEHRLDTSSFFRPLTLGVGWIRRHLHRVLQAPQQEPVDLTFLPSAFRNELQFCERTVASFSLQHLAHPAWRDLQIYLGLKAVRENPEKEGALLRTIAEKVRAGEEWMWDVMKPYIDELPAGLRLNAAKANQLSLCGPRNYRRWCDDLAEKTLNAGETPCIVAHSGYLLLQAFLTRMQVGTLLTVDPRRLDNPKTPSGFRLEVDGESVDVQSWSFSEGFPASAVSRLALVDDRANTGSTFTSIHAAWNAALQPLPPITHERVLIDLRKTTSSS